jgi:hypothetical protein
MTHSTPQAALCRGTERGPQPHAGTAIMGLCAHVQISGGLTAAIELRASQVLV